MAGFGASGVRYAYDPTPSCELPADELEMLYGTLRGAGDVGFSSAADGQGVADDDGGLVEAMAARVHLAEAAASKLRAELVARDMEVTSLRRELLATKEELRTLRDQDDELEVVKIQSSRLALQVVEMTQFLREQGLSWVGSGRVSPLCRGDSSAPSSPTQTPPARRDVRENADADSGGLALLSGPLSGGGGAFSWDDTHTKRDGGDGEDGDATDTVALAVPRESTPAVDVEAPGMYFSLSVLKARVAELNLTMSERVIASEACLASGRTVVKFKDPDAIDVVLYADGIRVERGAFRPYAWHLCRAFVDDVLDGYFPYEYQGRYPDGVVINLHDKTNTKGVEVDKQRAAHVTGEGYRGVTKQAFVNTAPKTRITPDGKIVRVGGRGASVCDTVDDVIDCTLAGAGADTTVLLQVRIVGGGKLVARLHPHSTIGDVRSLIAARMPSQHEGKDFELLTAFPRVTFTDPSQTLQDANLVPNAALLMRVR